MNAREREAKAQGMVTCPVCRNLRYDAYCICKGSGLLYRGVALLHCELFQTLNDGTTQAAKDEVHQYAVSEYHEDIRNKPRTALDVAFDLMGIP